MTPYNLSILKASTGGDKEFLVKMLCTFTTNNRKLVSIMIEALNAKEYKQIGEIAHKMLSSYRHLEVNLLLGPLAILERMTWEDPLPSSQVQELVNEVYHKSNEVFALLDQEIKNLEPEKNL